MVPADHGREYCPDCGGKLLYNGQGLVCIRCPFAATKPPTERRIAGTNRDAREHREKT